MSEAARPAMPSSAFARLLGHLLARNGWAREKLAPFAGRRAHLALGGMAVDFVIGDDGQIAACAEAADADVRLELPATALTQLPDGPDALFRQARISGDAHFAETLGFVLRNLEWDAEEDLARVVGDPLAHRLHQGARQVGAWGKQAAQNLVENLREYAIDEARITPPRPELDRFGRDVATLRDDLARLGKRIDRLERGSA
jgi:ubiquinone biosynthesis accessory factor UbiJ